MDIRDDAAFTLAATGGFDHYAVGARPRRRPAFDAIADRLRAADATVTNLEVVATDGRSYATPPRTVRDQF